MAGKTKKKRRKTAGKKKPKIVLKGKSVAILTLVIVGLCFVFLALNGTFSLTEPKVKSVTALEKKQEPKTPQVKSVPAEKKSQENKKSSSEPPASVQVQEPAVKSSTKNDSNVSRAPAAQKESPSKPASSSAEKSPVVGNTRNTEIASVPSGQKPVPPKYSIPKANAGVKIAFVIDDAGLSVANTKRYTSLPFPVTVAVLPKLSHSKDCAYVVRSAGQELILHQPMQSINLNMNPGEGAIRDGMTSYEIASIIKENIEEIGPKVKGFNNHEGSFITADEFKMIAVLEVAQEKNIYFLDSRTNVETKAPQAALELDYPIYERDIFIDNVITKDAMLDQILRGLSIANKKGKAIMIGHVDKSVSILPDLLLELYPLIKENGYKICFVSDI